MHNKKILAAMSACLEDGVEVDLISVTQYLDKVGFLEEVGGHPAIAKLSGEMATAKNLDYHCDMIVSDFNRRVFINSHKRLIERAYDRSEEIDEIYAESQKMPLPAILKDHSEALGSVVSVVADEVDLAFRNPGSSYGIRTGVTFIEDMMGGWQNGEIVVIASRPSVGKTALALWCARHAQKPVYFVSAEMSKRMVALRLLAAEVGIPSNFLKAGKITGEEYAKMIDGENRLRKLPIYIDDRVRSPQLIANETQRMIKDKDIHVVFVDYLQLLDPPTMERGSNREREVALMSKILKDLAQDCHIPVIVLAQLNRQVEYTSRRPQKSDLRDSGAIEQDADVVIFLHPVKDSDVLEVIIDKNRNGPTGLKRMRFKKDTGSFLDLEGTIGGDNEE